MPSSFNCYMYNHRIRHLGSFFNNSVSCVRLHSKQEVVGTAINTVRFEVLTVVLLVIQIFCDVALC